MTEAALRNDPTLDQAELARFRAIASQWWDPKGKFRPLHELSVPRLEFIREEITRHFGRDMHSLKPFAGLRAVDIGSGGGLMSEPMARLGATVVGVEPVEESAAAARLHAEGQGLAIDYRVARVEELAAAGEQFDVALAMEVIEHVPDVGLFLKTCAQLVKPGGVMLLSTLNRTFKAYVLAIAAAEYVLGWVPRGTHQWERFVTPDEMQAALQQAGMEMISTRGITYNPLGGDWSLTYDSDVNYLAAAIKV
jgi:2-polyprenyl-6-hydroxyphenyl methylase / 3-demethylubiquinone-9 3-methyltransferase